MNKLLPTLIVTSVLMASPAFADQKPQVEVSATFSMLSKYMWRGWNLNDDLSGQGSFDLAYGGFNAGIFGGTDGTLGTEYDLYVGYGREINEHVAFSVGYIEYRYPNKGTKVKESHLTLDFNFASATYHDGEDGYNYIEVNTSFDLVDKVSLDLHYGIEDSGWDKLNDYQATLNYQINERYKVFIAGSDKEKGDSEIFAGLVGTF